MNILLITILALTVFVLGFFLGKHSTKKTEELKRLKPNQVIDFYTKQVSLLKFQCVQRVHRHNYPVELPFAEKFLKREIAEKIVEQANIKIDISPGDPFYTLTGKIELGIIDND